MKCTKCGKKIKFLNAGYATPEQKGKAPCLMYDPKTGKESPVCKPCFEKIADCKVKVYSQPPYRLS